MPKSSKSQPKPKSPRKADPKQSAKRSTSSSKTPPPKAAGAPADLTALSDKEIAKLPKKLRRAAKAQKEAADRSVGPAEVAAELRVGEGFDLSAVDPSSTPGFSGSKDDGAEALASDSLAVADFQERLWAASREGDQRRVLLVLQGMDTSGKGGILRHVIGAVDPQGVRHTAFKAPTPEERSHDFLWRIRAALPGPGEIGVFDRSHYEDVLAVRVHELVPRATWSRRYATINRFEAGLVAKGTTVVKVMLHLSKDEQKERLAERLERPDKHWKYNPRDVDERGYWEAYQEAYQVVLDRTSTDVAPWHVIPADKKWYARWAVMQLLLTALQDIDPQWPAADYDVEAEKARLAAT